MKRGSLIGIALFAFGALGFLFLPAFQGYHIGDCTQTDYSIASQWASVNVPQNTSGYPQAIAGKALPVNRLFQWCKPDENASDYSP